MNIIFFLIGIVIAHKGIRIRFNGNVEKLEGNIVDIIKEQDIDNKTSHYLVIEYFNGYNYIKFTCSIGTGFTFRKIGDRVTVFKNTDTGEVIERGELYGTLFMGITFMAVGLSSFLNQVFKKLR